MDHMDIDGLIASREMEVDCHACHTSNTRALGWLRNGHETNCDCCGELIVLGTSRLRGQIRDTERQMRELSAQLTARLQHNRASWTV